MTGDIEAQSQSLICCSDHVLETYDIKQDKLSTPGSRRHQFKLLAFLAGGSQRQSSQRDDCQNKDHDESF